MSETPGADASDQPRDDPSTGLFRPTPPQARPRPDPSPEVEDTAIFDVPIPAEPPRPSPRARERALGWLDMLARNWPVAVMLALFAVAALIVPTMTQVATTDDWGYTRSVEILLDEGRLTVFPVVAATAVGQIFWGALFGAVFGMSLGMMRVSTVVMVALGGVALYAILRQLGVTRSRSALGMGAWLFNPLTIALAFSFMTDAHFASAMLISMAFYLLGLRPGSENLRIVAIGSFFAGFAFLIRQQGALIPLAVGFYLVLTGRLWLRWADLRRLLAVSLLPAVMLVGYYVWLRWFNEVPDVQQDFLDEVRAEGWEGTWLLLRRIPIYLLFYAGLLLLPVLIAIVPWRQGRIRHARTDTRSIPRREAPSTPARGRRSGQDRVSPTEDGVSQSTAPLRDDHAVFRSPVTYYAFGVWATLVLGGLYFAGRRGQEMPFAPQWVGPGGLGPPDVLGSRQRLVERGSDIASALTIAAAVGALLLGFVICRRLVAESTPERAGCWLVMTVGIWQLLGILPPSYHYVDRGVTLDRYLLPVIAILIVAALWALRDVGLFQPVAWLALAAVAAFSIAGARDYLVYLDAVWDMAEHANDNGVANDRLDAGSGWDGYHLYTVMLDENVTEARSPRGSPWWVYFYAKPTDSSYIVTTDRSVRRGYVVVATREYDQWLEDDPTHVYLMTQWYLPFPVEDGERHPPPWLNRILFPGTAPEPDTTSTSATLD